MIRGWGGCLCAFHHRANGFDRRGHAVGNLPAARCAKLKAFGLRSAATKSLRVGMELAQGVVMDRTLGRSWVFIGFLAGMLSSASQVRADDSKQNQAAPAQPRPLTASVSSEPEQTNRWYGSWGLAVDGVALTFASLGFFDHSAPLCLVGGGIYMIGTPLIHVGHHQPGRAAGSFFLRAGLPAVFALVGYQVGLASWTDDHTSDSRNDRLGLGLEGIVLGAFAGGAVAAVIDDLLLAREPIRKEPSVTVAFVPTARGATLALGGRF